jgi:hypothetical protein
MHAAFRGRGFNRGRGLHSKAALLAVLIRGNPYFPTPYLISNSVSI